jgi:hypothetical protein
MAAYFSETINNPKPSAEDVTNIQQTLNLFSIAVDTNQVYLLDHIFAPDAVFTPQVRILRACPLSRLSSTRALTMASPVSMP